MSKGHRSQSAKVSNEQSWNNLRNKINNINLDYKPQNQINIHDFMLI